MPNELGWRSLFGAAYFEDAIKLRPNLTFQAGLRYEFTTGWNEESGRASNYLTGFERRLDHHSASGQFRVHPKQCDTPAGPTGGPGVGCFWEREDCRARRLRHVLFADRRLEFPAQLDPALQRIRFFDRIASFAGPNYTGRASGARHHLCAAGSAAQRQDADRSGMEFYGGAAAEPRIRCCAWPMSGRSDITASLSVDPNTIPAQICSSATAVPRAGSLPAASLANIPHIVPEGAQYIPGPGAVRPESQSGCGILLVHRRQQQLQRAANRREPSLQPRPAVPRELHLVEGSGHEFGAHRRAGQQPSANDSGTATICTATGDRRRTTSLTKPAFRVLTSCRSARAERGPTISAALETAW